MERRDFRELIFTHNGFISLPCVICDAYLSTSLALCYIVVFIQTIFAADVAPAQVVGGTASRFLQAPDFNNSCLGEIWLAPEYGGGSGTRKNSLGCTANEVSANATNVEGPTTCTIGSFIQVNVTATVYFNAQKRFNIGLYTFNGNGTEYEQLQLAAAIDGSQCAFQTISDDCSPEPENNTDNGVFDLDGEDACCDMKAQSGYAYSFQFKENLEIPCAAQYGESELSIQTCFTWDQNTGTGTCVNPADLPLYTVPGGPSKCECVFIPLDITVEVCFSCCIFM